LAQPSTSSDSLKNKVAWITGGGSGIGLAGALEFARAGAHVVISGRSRETLFSSEKQLKAAGSGEVIAMDVSDQKEVAKTAQAILKRLGHIDILVNSAGINSPKRNFHNVSLESWDQIVAINLSGMFYCCHAVLPSMRESNWGRIIFISSESAVQIPAEMIHYGTTKSAQLAVSRGLAESVAGTGITVNSVLPGPTMSEGVNEFVSGLASQQKTSPAQVEKGFFKTMRPSSLLKRFATPEEVANLVTYVCSPLSSATNGAALRVDGGVVRSIV